MLFVRAVSFFFLVCACFVCARLVLTTFCEAYLQKPRYFSIFLLFLGENAQKGERRTKKKARSDERKRFLFLFFGGKDLFVVCKRKHTDDELVTFVKGGGEAFNSLSRLFTSSNDDNV